MSRWFAPKLTPLSSAANSEGGSKVGYIEASSAHVAVDNQFFMASDVIWKGVGS